MKINAPVSVISSFNHRLRKVEPRKILWKGREYLVNTTGLHHTFREGRTLYHIFSVVAEGTFFRLRLNTENLFWSLDEIDNGV